MISWKKTFIKNGLPWKNHSSFKDYIEVNNLEELYNFLNAVHIRYCLVRPYQNTKNYPLVEARELLPSFDNDMWEYGQLPGFSLVAFERPLSYLSEVFQYDIIHPILNAIYDSDGVSCPLEEPVKQYNLQTLASRLPRVLHDSFRQDCGRLDTSLMDYYPTLLPYLLHLDRAHVFSTDAAGQFYLSGVFASFPSDIDSELKRFGMRMGKFRYGDNDLYERNRMFVYQYLMELYGFPIVSERRTSSALFARKLHKMSEKFLLRVLGQTDRTITTYIGQGDHSRYPKVEKIALVRIDNDQHEAIKAVGDGGFFVDEEKKVVIIRVTYRQHAYSELNIRQDRALSVASQEVLHPITGESLSGLNIIRDISNMFLRLNDIVRGEHTGRIVYKKTEVIENTDTEEKRLKVLYTWLTKHQRRIITYSDDFFAKVSKVLENYLYSPAKKQAFEELRDLKRDVIERYGYIQQARKVRILEELRERNVKGVSIGYRQMMHSSVEVLTELSHEIVNFFPSLVDTIINIIDAILANRYVIRNYIDCLESELTEAGMEIRKNYRRMITLKDTFVAIRKARSAQTTPKTL